MKTTREEVTLEILELYSKLSLILDHKAAEYYAENPDKILPSVQIRYKRICAYFAYLGVKIENIKHFYRLDFITDFKDYKFSDEVIPTINSVLEGNFKIENIRNRSIKFMILRLVNFRKGYIDVLENFFGGVSLMGSISIEERASKAFVLEGRKDIDNLIERLNKVITHLLFPQITEFYQDILIEQYNFPKENYKELEMKEWDEYYEGI